MADEALTNEQVAEMRKKRTFRKFTFRGIDLDKLLDLSMEVRWTESRRWRRSCFHYCPLFGPAVSVSEDTYITRYTCKLMLWVIVCLGQFGDVPAKSCAFARPVKRTGCWPGGGGKGGTLHAPRGPKV